MVIVTGKHLDKAAKQYPDAAKEIGAWASIVSEVQWRNMAEVVERFADADEVDGYVVFNFRHNRYRMITVIHFAREREGRLTQGHVYIRSFLTHKQYDNKSNWDKEFRR